MESDTPQPEVKRAQRSKPDPSAPYFRLHAASQEEKTMWWQFVHNELGIFQVAMCQLAEVSSWTRAPQDTLQFLGTMRALNKKRTAFWFAVLRSLEGSEIPEEVQFMEHASTSFTDLLTFDDDAKKLELELEKFMYEPDNQRPRSASFPETTDRTSDSGNADESSFILEQETTSDEPSPPQQIPEVVPQQPETNKPSEAMEQPDLNKSWAEIVINRSPTRYVLDPTSPVYNPIQTPRSDSADIAPTSALREPTTPIAPMIPERATMLAPKPPTTMLMHYATALRASLSQTHTTNLGVNGSVPGGDSAWPEVSVWQKTNGGKTLWEVPGKALRGSVSGTTGGDTRERAQSLVGQSLLPAPSMIDPGKASAVASMTDSLADAGAWPKPPALSQPARRSTTPITNKEGLGEAKMPAQAWTVAVPNTDTAMEKRKWRETAKQTTDPKHETPKHENQPSAHPDAEPISKAQQKENQKPHPETKTKKKQQGPKPAEQEAKPSAKAPSPPPPPLATLSPRRRHTYAENPKVSSDQERERKKGWRHLDYAL